MDPPKVRDYLLSGSHAVGRSNAGFVVGLGYAAADGQRRAVDIRRHAAENAALATEATAFGQRYEIRG